MEQTYKIWCLYIVVLILSIRSTNASNEFGLSNIMRQLKFGGFNSLENDNLFPQTGSFSFESDISSSRRKHALYKNDVNEEEIYENEIRITKNYYHPTKLNAPNGGSAILLPSPQNPTTTPPAIVHKPDVTVTKPINTSAMEDNISNDLSNDFDLKYCGITVGPRLFGGIDSRLGQFPWVVKIGFVDKNEITYKCMGTLITKRHVLTAAHCFQYSKFDQADHIQTEQNEIYKIENITLHPEFFELDANDIALLSIKQDVPLTPICLPSKKLEQSDSALEGNLLTIASFNKNGSESKSSINFIRLPIIEHNQCIEKKRQNVINVTIHPSQICVQDQVDKYAHGGDSGAPLMDVQLLGYTIIGVESYGNQGSFDPEVPIVFTRVASFLDWIKSNIHL